jgi:hypothetical protein
MIQALQGWFQVRFDVNSIFLDIRPPEREVRDAQISWTDIIRVCFKPGDYIESDEIYIFIKQQAESYRIPIDAGGGFELWMEIIRRGYFDAQLAIDISTKSEGVFCWPEG